MQFDKNVFTLLVVLLLAVLFSGCTVDENVLSGDFLGIYSENNSSNVMPVTQVYFCPEDNCSVQLISEINSAQFTIDVAIYSFTHDEISRALLRAKNRGVMIRVLFDYGQSNSQYSEDEKLADYGIAIK